MNLLKLSPGILCIAILLTACGGKDKKGEGKENEGPKNVSVGPTNSPGGKLDGAWEIKRAEGDMADLNVGTVYEFNGTKLSFGKGGFNNPGSTVITDSTFSFQADGNELKFMYHYHFNGDTLVVTMDGSAGQAFYMVKK